MSWVENIRSSISARPPPGTVQPMYGVPIVKYGPPPTPVPYDPGSTGPPLTGMPGFDWSGIWQQPVFSMPDFSHWGPSFPKFMASMAIVAYLALAAITVFGLAVRGGFWYIKKKQ
jgi:hypothetical protein